jgi:hypothetical protein
LPVLERWRAFALVDGWDHEYEAQQAALTFNSQITSEDDLRDDAVFQIHNRGRDSGDNLLTAEETRRKREQE